MSPLPFSFVGFQPLPEGFSSLGFWLSGHWPYLLFLALVGLVVILVRSWSWLLDWEGGRWWPVPASILPAMIPIAPTIRPCKANNFFTLCSEYPKVFKIAISG